MNSPDSRARREKAWIGIVLHHTGLPDQEPRDPGAWTRFFENMKAWLSKKDDAYLSAHYLIGRDGAVSELVNPDTHESFHAGVSEYWHPGRRSVVSDWNRYAIGIELLGDGNRTDYSPEQYHALAKLSRELLARYPTIHPQAIVGHEQIAPGRKSDPGARFDWKRFFGLLFA